MYIKEMIVMTRSSRKCRSEVLLDTSHAEKIKSQTLLARWMNRTSRPMFEAVIETL